MTVPGNCPHLQAAPTAKRPFASQKPLLPKAVPPLTSFQKQSLACVWKAWGVCLSLKSGDLCIWRPPKSFFSCAKAGETVVVAATTIRQHIKIRDMD
jgi:hypothetical protein